MRAQFNLILIAALLLSFGVVAGAWSVAAKFDRHMNKAYDEQLAATAQLAEAESALWQIRYGFSQFIIGDAKEQQRILEDEAMWHDVISARLDAYAKGRRSRTELEALAELRAEYKRFVEARTRFFDLWQAGQRKEAIAWRARTITPYAAATLAALKRQIAQLHAASVLRRAEAMEHVSQARYFVAGITISLVAMITIGYWIGRNVLGSILSLRRETESMLRERFGETLDLSATSNEVRALEKSLHAMTARFIAHSAELAKTHEALARQSENLEELVATRTAELESVVTHMEQQNREVTLRNEMGDLLQSCNSIQDAGAVIARFAMKLFTGASGAVYMASAGAETLVAVSRWGATVLVESLATSDCWAIRRGKTHLVTVGDLSLLCPHVNGLPSGLSICIPLSAQGAALGLLHMTCPAAGEPGGALMREKQALAEDLAAQVGRALANLRLREMLQQQSTRDALTGLYNRRYLEGALPRELARAQRGGRPLAVFMLDVDHFKNFNDTHGHDAGDVVLKALSKALRDNCRQGDIACRFGGEEFTLILPDASLPAAREWAERLMQRVRTMEVKAGGQILPKIAISMGLALLPQHGEDAETLLQAADLALYDAKHAGRDRLVVSGEQHLVSPSQGVRVEGEGKE